MKEDSREESYHEYWKWVAAGIKSEYEEQT
jgi:hypothetical protein